MIKTNRFVRVSSTSRAPLVRQLLSQKVPVVAWNKLSTTQFEDFILHVTIASRETDSSYTLPAQIEDGENAVWAPVEGILMARDLLSFCATIGYLGISKPDLHGTIPMDIEVAPMLRQVELEKIAAFHNFFSAPA